MTEVPFSEINTAACILFLGSGFSAECKNIINTHPPVGDGLRDDLVLLLGDPSYSKHDLQEVSDAIIAKPDIDLYQALYDRYTISFTPDTHRALVSLPWRRIYTTNYDDSVESCSAQRSSFSYDDMKPRKIPDNSIIHLHGSIRTTNRDNIDKQLILSEKSYIEQHLSKSPWLTELDRDVRFSDKTFFIGYKLKDHHITALLLANPNTKSKVFFVTRGTPDTPTTRRLKSYGEIIPDGIPHFSEMMRTLPPPSKQNDLNRLSGLRHLDPHQDKSAVTVPTFTEVKNLLTFGTYNFKRMIAGLDNDTYVVNRPEHIEEAVRLLDVSRTLMIDAHLGNGKTIFLNMLSLHLSTKGYTCFMCKSNAQFSIHDLDTLRNLPKVAIFFDSYGLALDLIREYASLSDSIFIVSVRSSVRAAQMHEILGSFPAPVRTMSIDRLKGSERSAFTRLVDRAGLISTSIDQKIEVARDFRELVLTIFDNYKIRESIKSELIPFFNDRKVRKIFLTSYVIKLSGHDADPTFLRDITGSDPYEATHTAGIAAHEIFEFEDQIQVRSATFAAYVVENFFDSTELIEIVEKLIIGATLRREQLAFRRMAGTLMQVSFLRRLLDTFSNKETELLDLFERLRLNMELNKEPLFWLQYAILVTETSPDTAENFIATAYRRAEYLEGFLTYQIDTYALNLALNIEMKSAGEQVARFEYIILKLVLVIEMIKDLSHRYFAVAVLGAVEDFVLARKTHLSINQKTRLTFELSRAARALSDLDLDYKVRSVSEVVRDRIERAIKHLVN